MSRRTLPPIAAIAMLLACGCAKSVAPAALELGGVGIRLADYLPLDADGRMTEGAEVAFETPDDWLCVDSAGCSSCANLGEHPTTLRVHLPEGRAPDRRIEVPARAVLQICGG
ncbi:MAG: hypothetical protein U0610_06165 [bacterium]